MDLLDTLDKSREDPYASYQGGGKWSVRGLGIWPRVNWDELIESTEPTLRPQIEALNSKQREEMIQALEQRVIQNAHTNREYYFSPAKGVAWSFYTGNGLWTLYESSRAIEAADDKAKELLFYIQSFTE